MERRYILIALLLSLCILPCAYGQHDNVKKDSLKVYRSIETFSNKRKITKFFYDLFFVPVSSIPTQQNTFSKKRRPVINPIYEGKIVRQIFITTLNPFGYSISDTTVQPLTFAYKAGNDLHIQTRQSTIRNLLLFHNNKPFDSLLVKESERLIRTQPFVHDVLFTVLSKGKKSDSVDIYIRVLDTWSVLPDGAISNSSFSIGLEEMNFLGLGHDVQSNFSSNFMNGKSSNISNYIIPNYRNSYIRTVLHYDIDGDKNYSKILSIERSFFSSFTKWAGGIYLGQRFQTGRIVVNDTILMPQNFKLNTQDYWLGYAHNIFHGNTENARSTNLTIALRYARFNYVEGPAEIYDPLNLFADKNFYLTSIGISRRKYIQDKYIFNYGLTEDVPVGMVYSLTGGYIVKNNSGQLYLGAKASFGNYFEWGYLSTNLEYGTFLRSANSEQGVFSAGFKYFTKLFKIDGFRLRQFIKPQYILGINRLPNESLNINNENGIVGFNSPTLIGTQKILLNFQTQIYLPWRILGFHFGPYFVYSMGMLGNDATGFKNSRMYSQFGLGLLIKNEFLVFDIFQISIAFYPSIPGMGNNMLKIDPDKASDFGFQNFYIGKPATVVYR